MVDRLKCAISVIESVAGFTDDSTAVGEAWLLIKEELLSRLTKEEVEEMREKTEKFDEAMAQTKYCEDCKAPLLERKAEALDSLLGMLITQEESHIGCSPSCPVCQGTGKITRSATVGEVMEFLLNPMRFTYVYDHTAEEDGTIIGWEYRLKSGTIMRLKKEGE